MNIAFHSFATQEKKNRKKNEKKRTGYRISDRDRKTTEERTKGKMITSSCLLTQHIVAIVTANITTKQTAGWRGKNTGLEAASYLSHCAKLTGKAICLSVPQLFFWCRTCGKNSQSFFR